MKNHCCLQSIYMRCIHAFRPFRGVGAVVAGAGPAHAFYFATYEQSKEVLSNVFPAHDQISYGMFTFINFASGKFYSAHAAQIKH